VETFAPPSFDPSTVTPVYGTSGGSVGPGGFDPAGIFALFAVLFVIGLVVHLAMAAMVMREAKAAGENPTAWGILAFSRPFMGYALWRSQGPGGRRGPAPMVGFGSTPQRPPDMDAGFGAAPGWPRDADDPPGMGNPGQPGPPPPL
jgi:hypothetical protein